MIKADGRLLPEQGQVFLEDLSLSNRAKNALIDAGYQTLEDCKNLTLEDLCFICKK